MANTVDPNVDKPPMQSMYQTEKKEEEEEERPPLPELFSPWKVYLQPYWLTLILNNTKLIFGLLIGVWYLTQFIGAVSCINLYSDIDRTKPCVKLDPLNPAGTTHELNDGEKSSEVYDAPLVLLAIFHIIEWIRTTVLLTVILIGVNWAIVWYVTTINTLFGLIVYAFAHMAYFDEYGELCAENQPDRASWLLAEIIAFWVSFFFFAFPFTILFCRGKERADATLKEAYEKSAEDSD